MTPYYAFALIMNNEYTRFIGSSVKFPETHVGDMGDICFCRSSSLVESQFMSESHQAQWISRTLSNYRVLAKLNGGPRMVNELRQLLGQRGR